MTGFYEKLLGAADKDHIKVGEEMRKHTSFRVGACRLLCDSGR